MKATSGEHYVALDHVRAIAAMLVFVWHFLHGLHGSPVPFEGTPVWGPLVLFDEGHVGVALFMTLSGYLFAKLLDGKRVVYHLFFWNRALRLMPLLLFLLRRWGTKGFGCCWRLPSCFGPATTHGRAKCRALPTRRFSADLTSSYLESLPFTAAPT